MSPVDLLFFANTYHGFLRENEEDTEPILVFSLAL